MMMYSVLRINDLEDCAFTIQIMIESIHEYLNAIILETRGQC